MVANLSRPTLRHMVMETLDLQASDAGIAKAVELLSAGGLVAMPTETVYGLAADASNDTAVARIFDAKQRPMFNPLIAHVADMDVARRIGAFSPMAEAVAQSFWPGALTLVLPIAPGAKLSPLVTAGLDTVAIRMPAHPVAQRLLRAFGGPLAAPSANPSGKVSPTSAAHVREGLAGRIDAIIDGGDCTVGLESTILGLDGPPRLLRPGGIPVEALEAMLGPISAQTHSDRPNAPGQLASHYAPDAAVRLEVTAPKENEIWVGFGSGCEGAVLTLSANGDLVEAAANLFRVLREADSLADRQRQIAFAPVPEHGLGRAINDRLRRASAPRP